MDPSNMLRIGIGAMMIAIGIPLFALGRYLSAPENKKGQKLQHIKIIAILWMSVGVLLYLVVLLTSLH